MALFGSKKNSPKVLHELHDCAACQIVEKLEELLLEKGYSIGDLQSDVQLKLCFGWKEIRSSGAVIGKIYFSPYIHGLDVIKDSLDYERAGKSHESYPAYTCLDPTIYLKPDMKSQPLSNEWQGVIDSCIAVFDYYEELNEPFERGYL